MPLNRESLRRRDHQHWFVLTADAVPVQVPGARDSTVAEYVGHRIRHTHRYGRWIEIPGDVARSDDALLTWCQRYCNSELPAGGFRFAPADWDVHSSELLPRAYIPELDDDDPAIRRLLSSERQRRIAQAEFRYADRQRRGAIQEALAAGRSLRELAQLLRISFARVRQIRDSS